MSLAQTLTSKGVSSQSSSILSILVDGVDKINVSDYSLQVCTYSGIFTANSANWCEYNLSGVWLTAPNNNTTGIPFNSSLMAAEMYYTTFSRMIHRVFGVFLLVARVTTLWQVPPLEI
jgi:hypothetical protein